MRAEDVLVAARYATKQPDGGPVDAVGYRRSGTWACRPCAAALGPSLFNSVKLVQAAVSWASLIERRVTVNNTATSFTALLEYDL
jgi:hypothetical protein